MALPITYLFVPGNRPERFEKALASGADAVILDLEDAVAPADKDWARDEIGHWLNRQEIDRDRIVVRINDAATPWFAADLAMLSDCGVGLAMLPKTESASQIAAVAAALLAEGRVLPLIETARGVAHVEAIAVAASVQRLAFGTLDYGVDLDLSGDERGLAYPAARIAIASRCADLAPPIAGVTPSLDDEARLLADLAFARAFGFGAKLCIHPKQVTAVRATLQPSAADIEWAHRVIAAANASKGAAQLDGKMIDRPVLLKARHILERSPH